MSRAVLAPLPFLVPGSDRRLVAAGDPGPASWDLETRRWSVARWRPAFQNAFAARMDWCVQPYAKANHNPNVMLNGDGNRAVLEGVAQAGSIVHLSAEGSSDPNGNRLSYRWFVSDDASSHRDELDIQNEDQPRAAEIHIVLAATGDGDPPLEAYGRPIIRVKPGTIGPPASRVTAARLTRRTVE